MYTGACRRQPPGGLRGGEAGVVLDVVERMLGAVDVHGLFDSARAAVAAWVRQATARLFLVDAAKGVVWADGDVASPIPAGACVIYFLVFRGRMPSPSERLTTRLACVRLTTSLGLTSLLSLSQAYWATWSARGCRSLCGAQPSTCSTTRRWTRLTATSAQRGACVQGAPHPPAPSAHSRGLRSTLLTRLRPWSTGGPGWTTTSLCPACTCPSALTSTPPRRSVSRSHPFLMIRYHLKLLDGCIVRLSRRLEGRVPPGDGAAHQGASRAAGRSCQEAQDRPGGVRREVRRGPFAVHMGRDTSGRGTGGADA
jgi:hypothetical protein